MKRLLVGGVAALALVLAVLSGGAAGAVATTPASARTDTASTKAFIALQERNDLAPIRLARAVNAAQDAVVAHARAGCSNVLKEAPKQANAHQSRPMLQFYTEMLLTLNVEQLAPVRGISDRIGSQQQRLRFSDPALQWQVDVGGSALLAYVDLRPPDLCTGARVLAASHFTKLTAAGTRFTTDASTLFPLAAAEPTSLVRLMRPYAPAAVSAALTRLPELQRTLDRTLAFGRHFRALVHSLGATHLLTATGSALAGAS